MTVLITFVLLTAFLSACTVREREGGDITIFGYEYNVEIPPVVYIENEFLKLEFLTGSAEIVLTDKTAGGTFRSTPENAANCTESAAIERFYSQSLLIMEYQNRSGNTWYEDTYRYAVRTTHYEHAIIGGALEVYFTIGNIPRVFHIPSAMYDEDMRAIWEQLPRTQRLQLQNIYNRTYNLDTLRPNDNRSELLEQFPTLADGRTIHVLNDNIQAFLRAEAQEIFQSVGYMYDDWLRDMNYFNIETTVDRAVFNVTMRFELDGSTMVVTIPFDDITYNPSYVPTALTVMPYFGSGHKTDEGYLFVPDGPGALMYFGSSRNNQNHYFNRVFGWDTAIIRNSVMHDNVATYPVFGVHKNDTTFVGIIQEGAAYASIRAESAGINSPHNRVHPIFRLLHGAPLDVAGRTDTQLLMHEWELPAGEQIVIRYTVTQTQGYVGMAHAFRDYVQARYPWMQERVNEPVTAMVEILGAALTPQHFLGMPIDRSFPLTTYSQAADMMETLHGFGWRNLYVKMTGAHNRSIDHNIPSGFNLISQLGNRRSFNNMLNTADTLGYDFYIEGDFVFMRQRGNSWFNGFSPMRDAARQANRQQVRHNGYSHVYWGELGSGSAMSDSIILATPGYTQRLILNFIDEAAGYGVSNIAFRSIANSLSGDFNEDRHVSREASMNMRVALLADLRAQGTGVWLNHGFSYAVPYANVITGMPLDDQAFTVTDISVPFYQIALHGLVHFAGRPMNLAEDFSEHLLKTIESGSALFFCFMQAPTTDLQVTRYQRFYANEFGRWANVANDMYQRHKENFEHLYNQFIVDHIILCDTGVTVTVYEDGTRVYVNASKVDFDTDTGVFIPARQNGTPFTVIR